MYFWDGPYIFSVRENKPDYWATRCYSLYEPVWFDDIRLLFIAALSSSPICGS